MQSLKIHKIGNSLGVTLPPEILQKLQVGEGDSIFLIETNDGIQIAKQDREFDRGLEAYQKVADKYKNALKELAQ
jgi:putative addiction module antidote